MDRTQIGYVLGIVVGFIVALLLAPLFPLPVSTIVMWLGYVVAALCVVLLLLSFVRPDGLRTRRGL